MGGSSEPELVAEQAAMLAAAWSPAGAPPPRRLTAALFETLRQDRELLTIAAAIPAERLPLLLARVGAAWLEWLPPGTA